MVTKTEEILGKQSEILSHQKNFNLILAIATCFLVLIYALSGSSYFLRFSSAISDVIIGIIIIILFLLFLFIIKRTKILFKIYELFEK